MSKRLSREDLVRALDQRPNWVHDRERNALHRKLIFADFGAALGLMVRIGLIAETMNHHPELTNVFNRIDIWLTTHDAGGVTRNDLDLADAIDRLVPESRQV